MNVTWRRVLAAVAVLLALLVLLEVGHVDPTKLLAVAILLLSAIAAFA